MTASPTLSRSCLRRATTTPALSSGSSSSRAAWRRSSTTPRRRRMSDDLEIHGGAYGSRGGAGHGPEDRDHNVAVPSAVSQRPSSTLPVMRVALISPVEPLLGRTAALFWPVPVGALNDGPYVAACVTDPAVLTDA